MIKIAMYTTIITLHKQGVSERQIAKTTGVHRTTIRKIIYNYKTKQIEEPVAKECATMLDGWHEQIINLKERSLSTVRIWEELQSMGCSASYSSLTRYIRKHNIKNNTCIRFHTKAGEEAQVDFGDIGLQYNPQGKRVKAYIFNMRLSYSRLDYYEVVFDQSIETWIQCHINAFTYFAGTPEVIKLDNLKAGVVSANFYEPVFQKEYLRLAKHYNTLLSPCRPYQPQEKGKVESGIKYIKNNFFSGREFNSYNELTSSLARWQEKANLRIHGTTKQVPQEVFMQEESSRLKTLPADVFDLSSWHNRKVARDCHVTIENNYYSVPSKYVSCMVLIQLKPKMVQIYSLNNELLARHERVTDQQGIFTTNTSHYAKYKRLCPGFTEYEERYLEQIAKIGKNCQLFVDNLKQVKTKDWHRAARGIVALRKNYSDELIDKACLRALHYGITSYGKIKKMLESNAINLPLPSFKVGGCYARTA